MHIITTKAQPAQLKTDCLITGVYEKGELSPSAQLLDKATQQLIRQIIALGDFTGEIGQTLMLNQPLGIGATRLLLVGLGAKEKLTQPVFYQVAQTALAAIVKLPVQHMVCYLSEIHVQDMDLAARCRTLAQVTETANYQFTQCKSPKKPQTPQNHIINHVELFADTDVSQAIKIGQATAQGMNVARSLANLPPNICTPAYLAQQAQTLAEPLANLEVEILDEKAMAALNMGALLAVGRGGDNPPRLIILRYQGDAADKAPIVLVGKGVTFDTGGISLKQPLGMEDMKFDMAGGASVIGTLFALATLKAPVNVIGVIPSAENMPDGKSYRPGDILTSMSGQTIEVTNTDAEGRLLLCDALTYVERFNPKTVIDVATLTGAMVMSLGYALQGVFSPDDTLAQALVQAGKRSNDEAWHMPMVEAYQETLKSHYADMINACRTAGAITAALFLSRFTQAYRWAHIDCAGTAMPAENNKANGATGRPVALLVEYVLNAAR